MLYDFTVVFFRNSGSELPYSLEFILRQRQCPCFNFKAFGFYPCPDNVFVIALFEQSDVSLVHQTEAGYT
ncbi:MAG TPA: hypothetical protein DCM62_04115 [Bacteroidales bacterium]|nr:hypothetical protein [Bacteroidales bacterium]